MKSITFALLLVCVIALGAMGYLLVQRATTTSPADQSQTRAFPATSDIMPPRIPASNDGTTAFPQDQATVNGSPEPTPIVSSETFQALVAASKDLNNEGWYLYADAPGYQIFLVEHSQYIMIRAKQIPADAALAEAEARLSAALGIGATELCTLDIDVFMPASYDPNQSQDLGLSACPGPKEPSHGTGQRP